MKPRIFRVVIIMITDNVFEKRPQFRLSKRGEICHEISRSFGDLINHVARPFEHSYIYACIYIRSDIIIVI